MYAHYQQPFFVYRVISQTVGFFSPAPMPVYKQTAGTIERVAVHSAVSDADGGKIDATWEAQQTMKLTQNGAWWWSQRLHALCKLLAVLLHVRALLDTSIVYHYSHYSSTGYSVGSF